jgi:hypothetical protein
VGVLMEGLSKPHTKAGRLQRECLKLLAEHEEDRAIPTSNRFLFYELESRGIIPKVYRYADGRPKPRTPSQDVSDATKHLRELGVPWDYIVDETRFLQSWPYAESVYRYVTDALEEARIDLWDGASPPLILCESRSLAGVLENIAGTYLCPIASTNGQVGGFLHTDIAPLVEASGIEPLRVFYFGDLDLSGGHIAENTYDVLGRYGDLDWKRLAITELQVREHNLTKIDKKDHRFKPARSFPAYETEALKQTQIQQILTTALQDAAAISVGEAIQEEERQRVNVREMLSSLGDE